MAITVPPGATLALNIPFDESFGSLTAQDYSASGLHGTVYDGSFVSGRDGNCIYFPGTGYIEIEEQPVDFSDEFSIMLWVKLNTPLTTVDSILLSVEYTGHTLEVTITATLEDWTHIAITRSGITFNLYINGIFYSTSGSDGSWGDPIGLSIVTNDGVNGPGNCYLDDFQIINGTALTQEQIGGTTAPIIQTSIRYYLNYVELGSMGIIVSKIKGIVDKLAKKENNQYNWQDRHGIQVDSTRSRYISRSIELECWIKRPNKAEMMNQIFAIKDMVERNGTMRLMIDIGDKPLVYEVECVEEVSFESVKWRDGNAFCSFTLKLVENEPVKRVLRYIKVDDFSIPIGITISTQQAVNIYWGDGTMTGDVYGTNIPLTHDYTNPGTYYIIVAGVIEDITFFNTNAVVVWPKLQ